MCTVYFLQEAHTLYIFWRVNKSVQRVNCLFDVNQAELNRAFGPGPRFCLRNIYIMLCLFTVFNPKNDIWSTTDGRSGRVFQLSSHLQKRNFLQTIPLTCICTWHDLCENQPKVSEIISLFKLFYVHIFLFPFTKRDKNIYALQSEKALVLFVWHLHI